MRRSLSNSLVLAFSVGALQCASGCFDDAPGDDPFILCVDDDGCPSDLVCAVDHVCRAAGVDVDIDPPGITSATVEPAVAKDGVVSVTVVADEDIAAAALVFDGVADPGFVAGGVSGNVAVFTVDVGARDVEGVFVVAEGFYPLRAVRLTDSAGNERDAPVNLVVEVDRTAPTLAGVSVSGGVDGVFSDRDPAADVVLTYRASEPVTVVDAAFGDAPLLCGLASDAGGGGDSCVGRIVVDDVVDGANLVRLAVVDGAGNSASASVSANVDLLPPAVLGGAVEFDVDGDRDALFATVGDRLHVRFVVDELLSAPPVVSLRDNPTVSFLVTGNGQVFDAEGVVDVVVAAGAFAIDIEVVDAFGHAATVPLPLPAPHEDGLRLVQVAESPCLPARDDGDTCADYDGDGFVGASAGCAVAQLDCDDTEPTVFPGALAVELDGLVNNCDGDAPAPRRLHIDANSGDDDTGDGTAARPLRTLGRALTQAEPDDALLLAVGDYPVFQESVTQDLYGSLDPTTWTPAASGRTRIAPFVGFDCDTFGMLQEGEGVIVGVDFDNRLLVDGGVLVDVGLPDCGAFVGGRAVMVNVRGGDVVFNELSAQTRVIDGALGQVFVERDTIHFLRTRVRGGALVERGGGVEFVNSTISAQSAAVVACNDCARVNIAATNLIATDAGAAVRTQGAGAIDVRLLGVNASVSTGGVLVDVDEDVFVTVSGTVVDIFDGVLLRRGTVDVVPATGGFVSSCPSGEPHCINAALLDLTFDTTGLRAAPLTDEADFVYASGEIDAFSRSYVADVDGECRFVDGVAVPAGPDR